MSKANGQLACGACGVGLDRDEACGKLIGCEHCDEVFCSADCAEHHDKVVAMRRGERARQDRLHRQAKRDNDRH